jgi:hypothetical protein
VTDWLVVLVMLILEPKQAFPFVPTGFPENGFSAAEIYLHHCILCSLLWGCIMLYCTSHSMLFHHCTRVTL